MKLYPTEDAPQPHADTDVVRTHSAGDISPPVLAEALRAVTEFGLNSVVLCVAFPLRVDAIRNLLADRRITALLIRTPPATVLAEFPERVSLFSPPNKPNVPSWSSKDTLVFIGLTCAVPRSLLTSALRAGLRSVVVPSAHGWRRTRLLRLLFDRYGARVWGVWARPSVKTLDQVGRHISHASVLARKLNQGAELGEFINANSSADCPKSKGIAFYTGSLGAGGAERQMTNTILGLCDRGIGPIRVACSMEADGFYRPVLEAAGVKVDLVRSEIGSSEPSLADLDSSTVHAINALPVELVGDVLALRSWLRKSPPEVLHCWQDHCNIAGGLGGLMTGVPRIILSTRSVAPYHFGFFQLNQRPVYHALSKQPRVTIINNSAAGAKDYQDWANLSEGMIKVVYNGVDKDVMKRPTPEAIEEFRASLGIPAGAPVVGTIFTFYPVKRPLLWLEAARLLSSRMPDAHFLMIGDGSLRERMIQKIAKSGLAGKVHLPGRRTDIALPLSAMSAFMLTSRIEGLPNVLLEAQSMGVPVVTVAAGGAPEAVDEDVTGLVVANATAVGLARAVERVLKEPRWAHCGTTGPAFVESRFGQSRMIDETLAIYGMPQYG